MGRNRNRKEQPKEDEIKILLKVIGEPSIEKLRSVLENKLNQWRDIPLRIAITGTSGSGKSSFINAVLGLSADDEGAAPVGVVETTTAPKEYIHPDNDKLILVDLPGVGTPKFPRSTYAKQVQLPSYDFFLIFSHTRFTEHDGWLVEQMWKFNKKCFFVRTKVDLDMKNDEISHPKSHDKEKVLTQIRKDCIKSIGAGNIDVFLINNHDEASFDFDMLVRQLLDNFPERKKDALALTLSVYTKGVIEAKREILRKRIKYVSMKSAVSTLVQPIPGLDVLVDKYLIAKEVSFYCKVFGFDEAYVAENLHVPLTPNGVIAFIKGIPMAYPLKYTSAFAKWVPIVGYGVAATNAFGRTYSGLETILDKMTKKAHDELHFPRSKL